jgi:hypothetical protein
VRELQSQTPNGPATASGPARDRQSRVGSAPAVRSAKGLPCAFRYPLEGNVPPQYEASALIWFFDVAVDRYLPDVAQFVIFGAGFDTPRTPARRSRRLAYIPIRFEETPTGTPRHRSGLRRAVGRTSPLSAESPYGGPPTGSIPGPTTHRSRPTADRCRPLATAPGVVLTHS